MRLRSEGVLAPLDLRPRHLVTLTIVRRPRRGHPGGAGRTAGARPRPTSWECSTRLEEQGLIERRRLPTDRRRHVVDLTDAGRERLAEAEFALAAAEDDVLAALAPEQRVELATLLHLAAEGLGDGCRAGVAPCAGADPDCSI